MKNYPIFKKRDGQGWKNFGSIYASSFEEACAEWTKRVRKDLSNKNDNTWYYSEAMFKSDGIEEEDIPSWFEGDGYYCEKEVILLDSTNDLDGWSEDVYSYKVVNSDSFEYQREELAERMSNRFSHLY